MIRRSLVLATAVLLSMSVAGPALAGFGGGTIVRVDHAPDEFVAGETYEVMYTVLFHGTTPVAGTSAIVLHAAKGTSGPVDGIVFSATPTKTSGQYIAEVTVPEAGTWLWAATHSRGHTDLGSIEVAPMTLSHALRNDVFALVLAVVATAGLALFVSRAQIKLGPRIFDHPAQVHPEGA